MGWAVLAALGACGEGDGPPTEPSVPTSMSIAPATAEMASLGEVVRFTATVVDQYGQPIAGVPVGWSSSSPGVATVDAGGAVTARRNGTTTVTAQAGNAAAAAAVTVAQRTARVEMSPSSVDAFASVGDTVRFAARPVDANGNAVEAAVGWSSSDDAVATVDSAGLATTTGNGTADITASAGGAAGSVAVTVSQVIVGLDVIPAAATLFSLGDSLQLLATGVDANGNPAPGRTFTWESEHPDVATVDATGLVVAVRTGGTEIFAYSGEDYDSAGVNVAQLAAEVRVTPAADTLDAVGDTVRLRAEALDARGNLVEDAGYIWSSPSPGVATVDDAGLVTAIGAGTARVRVQATRAGVNRIAVAVIVVRGSSGGGG